MYRRLYVLLIAVIPAVFAADKPNREILELQRQVAQFEETVRNLQRSLEERMSTLGGQVQGAAEAARQAGTAVGTVQRGVERAAQAAQEQSRNLTTQVAGLGSRLEQVSNSVTTMQQAISDLTSVMTKLQSQIADLTQEIRANAKPVTAPAPERPSMPATELLAAAERDRIGGKFELAVQEYTEFLKWYSDSPQAGEAHFYLGWIHYSMRDYEAALAAFRNYKDKPKMADALDYQAKCLTALGRPAEAAEVRKELAKLRPAPRR
jgi:TolA-binding protein